MKTQTTQTTQLQTQTTQTAQLTTETTQTTQLTTRGKDRKRGQKLKAVRLKERPGFTTFGMRIIYRVLYLFIHCRLIFDHELPEDGEPVVFVANHYNVFGPASFILSVPLLSSVWINEDVIQPETAAGTIFESLRNSLPFLPERVRRWISVRLGRLACNILVRFRAIPVDRHNPGKLISTMRQSVAALEKGQNIIIFPEVGIPEYSITSVTPFFSGFATIGSVYYRKTKKKLRFCPCYIDEQHHTIRFGELVTFEPEVTSITEESTRVSDELNLRIREMALASYKSPKEKSTPVRQTIMFFCNFLRLIMLVVLVILLSMPNAREALILYGVMQGLRILFNATVSRQYVASNHFPFLMSHALGIVTDICMLAHLQTGNPELRPLLFAVIANCLINLSCNTVFLLRERWCAGVNYFDTLSGNLICFICFQQILEIPMVGFFFRALLLLAYIFLGLSVGYSIIFNTRFREESAAAEEA